MMNKVLQILLRLGTGGLAIAILIAAGWYSLQLIESPVKAPRARVKPTTPVVGLADLKTGDHAVSVEAFGTLVAARELTLRPEVRGRVIELHPELEVGGIVKAGEALVKIDPSDFEIAVRRAEAALAEVEVEWKIEQGRQVVAKREWELLRRADASDSGANDLALRLPQRQKIEAMRTRARADLDTARLALSRTVISAPFDAVVIEEQLEVGQLLDTNSSMANLVGTAEFRVQALVPLRHLELITFPDTDTEGSPVEIHLETGDQSVIRKGRILRRLADLDAEGRMARVLISVRDPLNLGKDRDQKELPLGSFVQVSIEAETMRNLVSIPRVALRENDRIWIRDREGKLRIREVDVVWWRDEDVLISKRFGPEEKVITTHLSAVIPGTPVRARSEKPLPVLTGPEKTKTGSRKL